MKKLKSFTILVATIALSSLICGCGNNKSSDTLYIPTENTTNQSESDSISENTEISDISDTKTQITESESTTYQTENIIDNSDNTDNNNYNNAEIETYTEIIYETKAENNTDKSSEYEYTLSDNQLFTLAKEKYTQAMEVYNDFIYNGHYDMDSSQLYFSENGESMLLITDSSIKSISDVLDDYAQYFSEKYENPIPLHYIENGNSVYYIQSDRGSDATYIDTEITNITKKDSDEVFFEAKSNYNDQTSRTDEFSLVYNENNVEWKIGIFTLPN